MSQKLPTSRIYFFLILIALTCSAQASDKNVLEQANIAFKDNNYNEALIHLKNLTQTDPDNLAARLLMAEVLIASAKGAAAEVELVNAERLGADKNLTLLLFAEAYLLQGKYNEVMTHLDNPVQEVILAAKVNVLRGHAQLGLRQLKSSTKSYKNALSLNVNNIDAKLGLAQVALNYYRFDEAQTYVNDVLKGYFPPVNAWILKASIHQSLAELKPALKAINKALLENPRHVQALVIRASLLIELGDYLNAQTDVDSIFKLVPNEPKAQFLAALIESKANDDISTKQQFALLSETISRLDNDTLVNNPNYYYLASVVAFQQGSYSAAEQYIKNYLEIDSLNIKAMTFSATIHIAMKNYSAAQSILNTANLQEENNPKVLSLLGLVSTELNQHEKAKFYFQQVVNLLPESSIASQQLAKNNIDMGEYQQAIDTLLAINSSSQYQSTISFLLVQAYVKSGQKSKALAIAEKLVQVEPGNKEFIHHLGFIYQIIADFPKAKLSFERALKIDTAHTKSIISLAETLQVMGQVKESFTLLEQALLVQENDSSLINALAKIYARTQQYEQSVVWFKKAYQLDNNNKELLKQLSFSYIAAGQPLEAIENIESYLTNHQKTADLYVLLAQYYQQQNNIEKALQNFNSAIRAEGNKGDIYFLIAQLYQKQNKYSDAIEMYKKSAAWSNNKQAPLISLSQLLNQQQNPLEAIKIVEQFLTKEDYSIQLNMVLAHAYYLSGQYDEAEDSYKKLLILVPAKANNRDNVIAGLSLVYQAKNQDNKAIKLLMNALEDKPESFLINSSLAEIHINKDQWQSAYDIYLHLLAEFPQQAMLLNNTAFIASKLSLFDDAKKYSLASLDITSSQPDSLDTLGWVYYQTQEFDKALPLFRQALALDFSKIEIKYHLVLTLKALNREKEAFNTLVEVVNSKREFSDKKEAIKLLNSWVEILRIKKNL
ncbi:XrtA/PEP-CTERM system TPR-repeat protein PrsT [Colwellia hornerae]|uniref:PEP-CTERM system TPR-repeat protein PrsT n=1 Tax=Colwellia hornerae TaxID=89402 RepID=A0A5C6Q7X7_9GAMM|nr:XrtA/PEP-CTERM system TPR-repeat protein PrsT [Colwellia hornerae]TWX57782.1 PEP-CTERM system TPR-repeat protein PrsT [Colwellia hornerae]TWX62487.1 PEP-CTERM system TPR-repeat protein PrsT [Colwellia hornerae]TWX65046.1 PEP-CTERM system TPR-repeat protein PrsT [Colwellia hornerae]